MDAMWRIEMFGGLTARFAEHTIRHFPTQKTAALLARLAYPHGKSHGREELAELLWPEAPSEQSRHNLRQALSALRRLLEPTVLHPATLLEADRSHVRLNPALLSVDVVDYEACLRSARQNAEDEDALLSRAVTLYGGELLPGYYEEWILAERERLAHTYRSALQRLCRLCRDAGEAVRALDIAHRLTALDPLDERSQAQLVGMLIQQAQPVNALRHYEQFARALAEFGAVPSAEFQRVATTLRDAHPERRVQMASVMCAPQTADTHTNVPLGLAWTVLPTALTRFFGRERELVDLQALLGTARAESTNSPRLITLTGHGGSGKTRLALEALHRAKENCAAMFVPLADVTEGTRTAEGIAFALQIPRVPDIDPLDQIIGRLTAQPFLLLLDNFEQIVDDGAQVVRRLLERVPTLVCLVTSRRRLGIMGEQEFPVSPLPIPTLGASPGTTEAIDMILAYASIQMFADRARLVRPDFRVDARNAREVALLCQKLEGIPLAIELATARLHVLTPAQMLEQLDDRFRFLISTRIDLPVRHRTLRATVEWSLRMLAPDLRRFFSNLCVFRGGWTLEAAEAVCAELLALDYLEQLQERSLVQTEDVRGTVRFRLLETLREYGQEQWSKGEMTAYQTRHTTYFLELAERADAGLRGPEQLEWLDRLEDDHDNLRTAIACALAAGDAQCVARLCTALSNFWCIRGYVREGRQFVTAALENPPQAPALQAGLCATAAALTFRLGDVSGARTDLDRALELYRQAADRRGEVVVLRTLGILDREDSRFALAVAHSEASLAICREIGDRWNEAYALFNLGSIMIIQARHALGIPYFERSLQIFREIGDKRGIAVLLSNLAVSLTGIGKDEGVEALHHESLFIRRSLRDLSGAAYALTDLAGRAMDRGELEQARTLQEESLAIRRDLGERIVIIQSLNVLTRICTRQGDLEVAEKLQREALSLILDTGQFGRAAYCFECEVELLLARKETLPSWRGAAALLGAAMALRFSVNSPPLASEREQFDGWLSRIRRTLGENVVETALAEGASLSWQEALQYALSLL